MRALVVGGCPAPWHRFEPAEPHFRSALEQLGYEVVTSGIYHPDGSDAFEGDYTALQADSLAGFDVVVLYTTGNDRFGASTDAIRAYVRAGGGLVGVHNATDSFTDDPEFVRLMGARFRTHPEQLDIALQFVDDAHEITAGLRPFTVKDELYLFQDYAPADLHLLAETTSYDDDGPVPLCWIREAGEGRVFYLSLGHNPETLANPDWRALFGNGVTWASRRG